MSRRHINHQVARLQFLLQRLQHFARDRGIGEANNDLFRAVNHVDRCIKGLSAQFVQRSASRLVEVEPDHIQIGPPQTLDYRDELIDRLGLTGVRNIPPNETERKVLDPKNNLWQSDPDACCALRKVRPLEPALDGFSAWITGRKRFHGGARLSLPVFEYADGRYKVNPLANWTPEDVDLLLAQRNLPRHPLVAQGYPSIGCWPCTSPSDNPNDPRAGRWAGQNKTECGLHIEKNERPRVF